MITSLIPDHWSAHEALAVFEFIDAIREEVLARYEMQIVEVIRTEYSADLPNKGIHISNDDEVNF